MASPLQEAVALTYGVGGKQRRPPELSTFRIPGLSTVRRELKQDDPVIVHLVDPDGEVVVSTQGRVTGVAFKKHFPRNGRPWVERIHAIELISDDEED